MCAESSLQKLFNIAINAGDELHWGDEIHWLSSQICGEKVEIPVELQLESDMLF